MWMRVPRSAAGFHPVVSEAVSLSYQSTSSRPAIRWTNLPTHAGLDTRFGKHASWSSASALLQTTRHSRLTQLLMFLDPACHLSRSTFGSTPSNRPSSALTRFSSLSAP